MTGTLEAAEGASTTSMLARRLAAKLWDALSRPDVVDFQPLDRIVLETVSVGPLRDLPGDQLHRLLVFALSETALADSARESRDWILSAAQLLLARAAAAL